MSRSIRSARARSFVAIAAAGTLAAISGEAAANPPAPTNWPDPPPQAPKTGAAATSIQKHDSGCFLHYDDGGNAKVDCPASLEKEPPGESIEKAADGTCHYMMTISWSGGSSGATPCPDALAGGAVTASTTTTSTTGTTAPTGPGTVPPPQRSSCGACAIGATSDSSGALAFALPLAPLAVLVARRSRRRRSGS